MQKRGLRIVNHIEEIHTAIKSGSSVPVIGTSIKGEIFIKLLGSGDGAYALISEYIINSFAQALGLPVLSKQMVVITESTKLTVLYEEVRDMVERSLGVNLGYLYYKQNKSLSLQEICDGLSEHHKNYLFLLDVLFRNIDRTCQNHGVIKINDTLAISDFGVSLTIRSALEGKNYEDKMVTKQLLKRHSFYSDDIDEKVYELFFSTLEKVRIDQIVQNMPNEWFKFGLNENPDEEKNNLQKCLINLTSTKNNFKIFAEELKSISKIDEEKEKEQRILNREKFQKIFNEGNLTRNS